VFRSQVVLVLFVDLPFVFLYFAPMEKCLELGAK
jgi:hypothetical protein